MPRQFSVPQVVLWLFVINLGIVIGGGLYGTLVIMPMWTQSPPDSVLAFYHHNLAQPQFVVNPGGRFWRFFTPALALLSVALILTGFRTCSAHRRWRIGAAVLTLIVVVVTFAWFIPNILLLMGDGVTKLGGDQITSITHRWVRLNWVRVAFYLAAWTAGCGR